MLKKKFEAIFKKLYKFLSKNLSQSSKKIWGWDPENNLFRILDPGLGVKKAPDPGSGTHGTLHNKN
jgi:hypothetical protein